jgi:hypothetical protein
MPPKREPQTRYKKETLRRDIEKPHSVWVRNDIWVNLKFVAKSKRISMKQIINEALYDYLLRSGVEQKTGMTSPYKETTYDPERGTLRKDEASSYIKEDDAS